MTDSRQDLICRCSGTTTSQLQRLIAQGITDLEALSQATGVCSGCGGCDADVLAFLAEQTRDETNVDKR